MFLSSDSVIEKDVIMLSIFPIDTRLMRRKLKYKINLKCKDIYNNIHCNTQPGSVGPKRSLKVLRLLQSSDTENDISNQNWLTV